MCCAIPLMKKKSTLGDSRTLNKMKWIFTSHQLFLFFFHRWKRNKKSSLMIFFCKIIEFICPHHPDRLCPASPATRLFGLLRQPTLKISIFYNEKNHRTVLLVLGWRLVAFMNYECWILDYEFWIVVWYSKLFFSPS